MEAVGRGCPWPRAREPPPISPARVQSGRTTWCPARTPRPAPSHPARTHAPLLCHPSSLAPPLRGAPTFRPSLALFLSPTQVCRMLCIALASLPCAFPKCLPSEPSCPLLPTGDSPRSRAGAGPEPHLSPCTPSRQQSCGTMTVFPHSLVSRQGLGAVT